MISSQDQKWAPQTMRKNNRKVHHSAEKSPCHTFYGVQVLEILVFQPQIQQDRLQRLLLGTRLHILRRSALEAAEKPMTASGWPQSLFWIRFQKSFELF